MRNHKAHLIDEINITPLTDIFLVLLIIMLVVAPLLNYSGVSIAFVSSKGSGTQSTSPKPAELRIDAAGGYAVNGKKVEASALGDLVRQLAANSSAGVVVEVHPSAPFDSMATALDTVQKAGVTQVSVTDLR